MRRAILFLPALVLLLFIIAVAWRLANPPDSTVRSRLEGQPMPAFVLPAALPGKPSFGSADLATGAPRLVNIFASWCLPCIAEAPVLDDLKKRGVKIDGIAIRDRPQDIADFLRRNGDPYERIGADDRSRVQLALGSSGVPESFVVDGKGVIRFQHIGAIMPQDVPAILAELEEAR